MKLDNIIAEIVDTLKAELTGTPVLAEDLGNVVRERDTAIMKIHRCITVGWNGCEHVASQRPQGDNPDALYVQANIVVRCYENPTNNRSDRSAPKLLGMAAAVARIMNGLGTDDMDEGLHFASISPIVQYEGGIVSCDVAFRTKNEI